MFETVCFKLNARDWLYVKVYPEHCSELVEQMKHKSLFKSWGWAVVILCLVFSFLGMNPAMAQNVPPQDHGGQDLIIDRFNFIWGKHTGIRNFIIPENSRAYIRHYRPDEPERGVLEIFAETIQIAGEIDGWGAGYTGGGGGGGGGNGGNIGMLPYIAPDGSRLIQAGQDGRPGGGNYCCFDGPSPGDGPARGEISEPGGYDVPGGNTDVTTDTSLLMGSGAGGARGAESTTATYPYLLLPFPGSPGGYGGGTGGGCVKLFAQKTMEFSGYIRTTGSFGSPGRPGFPAHCFDSGCIGGAGGRGGGSRPYSTLAVFNESGAGGGVLLVCDSPNSLTLTGEIDTRGGGVYLENGGTVKIFYRGEQPTSGTIQSPRVYFRDLGELPLSKSQGWIVR